MNLAEEESTKVEKEIQHKPIQTRSLIPPKKEMIIPARRNRKIYSKLATEISKKKDFLIEKYSEWEFEKLNVIFGTDSEPFIMFINENGLVHIRPVPLEVELKNHQSVVRISPDEVLFAGGVNYLFNSVAREAFIFNLRTLKVKRIGDLSYRRFFAKVIMLKDQIIIVGGREYGGDREAILGYCEEYLSHNDKWESFPMLNIGRCNFSFSIHNDKAMVIGGIGTNGKPIETIEVFSPKFYRWELLGLEVPGGVIGHLSVSLSHKLIVFGGVQKSQKGKIVELDTEKGADLGTVNIKQTHKKNVLSKSIILKDKILILGGYHSNKFIFNIKNLDISDEFNKLSPYRSVWQSFKNVSKQSFNLSKCSNIWPLAFEGYQIANQETENDQKNENEGIRFIPET